MKVFLLLSMVAIVFFSCNKVEVNVKPKACFDHTISSLVTSVDTVEFLNCSLNSDQYKWDFGDGSSSVEKNPMHIFKSKGLFRVKLLAIKDGDSDTISKLIHIPYYLDGQIIHLDAILDLSRQGMTLVYSLDFEGDGIFDLFINLDRSDGLSYSTGLMKISCVNYEIDKDYYFEKVFDLKQKDFYIPYNFDTIFVRTDTLLIPKINIIGDTIKKRLVSYKPEPLTISNFRYPFGRGGPFYDCGIWIKDEFRYIGFQKQYGDAIKIGWLKLKVLGHMKIELISYMVPKATESLIIDQ